MNERKLENLGVGKKKHNTVLSFMDGGMTNKHKEEIQFENLNEHE
jgi:hypothetical protein